MRAALCHATGDPALEVVDDVEGSPPGPGEVTIDIQATGVCHSDLHAMEGSLPQTAPFIPGHEGAGVVSAVGEDVTSLAVGDHVIVAWSPPCGRCRDCTERKSPHLCVIIQFTIAGVPRFTRNGEPVYGMAGMGTFAEKLTVPEQAAIKIDDDVPFEIASLIGCGVSTGVGAAINTAEVRPGSSVVVFGCGGVGIAAIQGARIAGAATIVAVDLQPAKLEQAKTLGATHACHPDDLAAVQAELTGDGFDYAFEAIGLPATMRASYDAVHRGGTAVIVGVGAMDQEVSFNAFEIFFSEKAFLGSYYGSVDVRSDFHKLLKLWKSGQLDLDGMITARGTIDDVNEAIQTMKRGEAIRTVLTFEDGRVPTA
ncbi:MAG TPA: Zn-dependent alcohol dehydrogenase [Iamia sp.]|jgi:S-(hydroxymethyl)glutathione dehydrogenase/alcohol dehydrogenase|nr:Zn-dependent alcohol dehydrogenase [Iamia sp.]